MENIEFLYFYEDSFCLALDISSGRINIDSVSEPFYDLLKDNNLYIKDGKTKKLLSKVKDITIYKDDNEVNEIQLIDGQTASIVFGDKVYAIVYHNVQIHDKGRYIPLPSKADIGRKDGKYLVLNDKKVSGLHCSIEKVNERYILVDNNSTNGTYINGEKVYKKELKEGDKIYISKYIFEFNNGRLFTKNADVIVNEGLLEQGEKPYPIDMRENPSYPLYECAHLNTEIYEEGEVALKNFRTIVEENKILTIISILIPIITGILYFTMGSQSYIYLVLTLIVPLSNFIFNTLTVRQRNKSNRAFNEGIVEEAKKRLSKNEEKYVRYVNFKYPSLPVILDKLKKWDGSLWGRRVKNEDFLDVRLGIGSVPNPLKVKAPELDANDINLKSKLEELQKMSNIDGVPITLKIEEEITGIEGDRESIYHMVNNIVLGITAHHLPNDVKVVGIFNEGQRGYFEWMKWLPHCAKYNESTIFFSRERAMSFFKNAEEELYLKQCYYVFIVGDKSIVENSSIYGLITKSLDAINGSVIILPNSSGKLPIECANGTVIRVNDTSANIIRKGRNISSFEMDKNPLFDLERYSRTIANIDFKEEGRGGIPDAVDIFDILGIDLVEDIDLGRLWANSRPYKSLAAPIGINERGEISYFDIQDTAHGPHGLIAGTSGSGKSKFLETIILSMAVHYSPYDVNFFVIDFKGGALGEKIQKLPHILGYISNLDGSLVNRTFELIGHEIKRREEKLKGIGSINDYCRLYKEGKVDEPLPRLIIIVDEFAEFRRSEPDFIKRFDTIVSLGRSLGVNLILSTQKADGIITPEMETNFNFRISLRMQNTADSMAVVKTPDAAYITQNYPGRAIFMAGTGSFYEKVQTAFCGNQYEVYEERDSKEKEIYILEDGKKVTLNEQRGIPMGIKLDVIVDYICDFWNGYMKEEIFQPFVKPLPSNLILEYEDNNLKNKALIGIADNIRNQRQEKYYISFNKTKHIGIWGLSETGKTNLLMTIIMSLCFNMGPDELNIYILDFDKKQLGMFKELPQVGDIVFAEDFEGHRYFKLFIEKQLKMREEGLREMGVFNIEDYNGKSHEKLPHIYIIADNLGHLIEEDGDVYKPFITEVLTKGGNLGVHMVFTSRSTKNMYDIIRLTNYNICFALKEKGDYGDLIGNVDGVIPLGKKGRAYVRGEYIMELQAYLPSAGEDNFDRIENLKSIIERIKNKHKGGKVDEVPKLPKVLRLYDDILKKNKDFFLMEANTLKELSEFFDDITCLGIAGSPAFCEIILIDIIISIICGRFKWNNMLYIFDKYNKLSNFHDAGLTTYVVKDMEGLKSVVESLKIMTGHRKEGLNSYKNSYGLKGSKKYLLETPPVFLIINDIDEVFYSVEDDLKYVVENSANLGIHIIVPLAGIGGSSPVKNMVKQWLVGDSKTKESLYIYGCNEQLKNDEAYYSVNNGTCRVKYANPYEGSLNFNELMNRIREA